MNTNQTPAYDEFLGYYNIPQSMLDDLGILAPVLATEKEVPAISTDELAEFVQSFPSKLDDRNDDKRTSQLNIHFLRCDRTAIVELSSVELLTQETCEHLQSFLSQKFPLWRLSIGMYSQEHTLVIYPSRVVLPTKFRGQEDTFWTAARKSESIARDNHVDSVLDRQHKLVELLAREKLSTLEKEFPTFVLAAFTRQFDDETTIVCYVVADKRFTKTLNPEFKPSLAHPAKGYLGGGYDWLVDNDMRILTSGKSVESVEYRARIVEAYYEAASFQNKCAILDSKTHEITWIKAEVPIWTPEDVRVELDKRIFGAKHHR